MNDDDVIARVRAAMDSQVSGVRSAVPELGPRYDMPVTEMRARRPVVRWLVPAALVAAAAVVLVVVLVTRGDNGRRVDTTPTTTPTVNGGLERWVLDLPNAVLSDVEQGVSSAVAVGTSVYYEGRNEQFGAALRTDGVSPLLSRNSWPAVDTVTVQGVLATRYVDDTRELLVVQSTPALIVETYGPGPDDLRHLGVPRWDSVALATAAHLVDGVWEVNGVADATEIGRRLPGTVVSSTTLRYEGALLTVSGPPGGLVEYLLDAGVRRGRMDTTAGGQKVVRIPELSGFALDRTRGAVVMVLGPDPSKVSLRQVDEATWRKYVAPTESLERWVLDLPGAKLVGAADASTSSTAIGTTVYFAGSGGETAAVRSRGAVPPSNSAAWPTSKPITVLGVATTLLTNGDHQLIVVPTDPAFSVETFGAWSAEALATTAHQVDGVWVVDATEIGRRSPEDLGLRYSNLQYEYQGHIISISVIGHPAGALGFLIDAGSTSGADRVVGPSTFVPIDPGSWVLLRDTGPAVNILDSSTDGPSDVVLASLKQVSDADWRVLVAPIRPDLATPGGTPPPPTTIPASPAGPYQAIGTVLSTADHGPELCLGAIADSLPPGCAGVPIVGWTWPAGTSQSANGTQWGEYFVTGTFDGTSFTLTAPARPPTVDDQARFPQTARDLSTPCPAPAGGWASAASKASTDAAALTTLTEVAKAQPDFVGLWLDQSINPPSQTGDSSQLNDPTKVVVNLAFTGDADRHRAELEKLWSGALCVSLSRGKSQADLAAIQPQLAALPLLLSSSIEVPQGVIVAQFVLATPELQATLDARFGPGVVVATSALQPVGS
jgi:hypothetical protein